MFGCTPQITLDENTYKSNEHEKENKPELKLYHSGA
jgi:hypothetical protein